MKKNEWKFLMVKSGKGFWAETFRKNVCITAYGKTAEEAEKNLELML